MGTNWRLLKGFISISALFTANAWFLAVFSQLGIVGLRLVQPDTAVVAYFAIAMQFFTTLMIFPISLSQAIVPGLSRAYRNQTETDLQTVATAMKAALIIGGMIAVVANATGPWAITLLFGDRYLAAGETFAWLSWAIGPYAAAFMAAQALNALDARERGALTALVMVGVHVIVMALLVSLGQGLASDWTGGSIGAATLGLLAGSFLGAAVGLAALGSRVKIPGHGWWIKPMVLTVMPAGVMHLTFLPSLVAGTLALFLLVALVWITGVFSQAELQRIAKRLKLPNEEYRTKL
jgi:O-antigen/teichoic acid export membrane protein